MLSLQSKECGLLYVCETICSNSGLFFEVKCRAVFKSHVVLLFSTLSVKNKKNIVFNG